jgi:hypothetical protein
MRKILLLAAIISLPTLSHARDSMDGCGLGWEVTDSETMIATTTRATTNNFVPPSFGMTTGTLGCKKLAFAANEKEAVNYVVNNFSNLKQELATGRGEYVEGLNEVMKCNGEAIRTNYNTVVAPAMDGTELYKNLKNICG